MGSSCEATCRQCGHRFEERIGGGFFFHLLHCDRCGEPKSVDFHTLGALHSAYLKGLPGPYSVVSARHDRAVKEGFEGPAVSEAEYHAAIEASLPKHDCGGRFRFEAPTRCPKCRSTDVEPGPNLVLYD